MFSTLSEGDAETHTRVVYLVGVISGRVEEGRWSRAGGGGKPSVIPREFPSGNSRVLLGAPGDPIEHS